MRFGILGALEVTDDEGRPLALAAPKQRAVLAILLLHANEVVSSDRLVEDLWAGEAPASAVKSLQVHVSRLRRALSNTTDSPEERLATVAGGYLMRVLPGELDADRFERWTGEASALIDAGDGESALGKLRLALDLWRGPPLSDFEYASFAQPEIGRLSELRVVAIERRISVELALGREGPLVGELEGLICEHPYRERLRGQLMLALYRSGRQAEALQAYRNARTFLIDELGLEPSPELRGLHEAVLAQDASLLVNSRASLDSGPASSVGRGGVRAPTNLPAPTASLVGRERERAKLHELLASSHRRVVTITGIGGIGKTRLALAVGADLLEHTPGGVFLVRLAGIRDPESILPMIADAVRITGEPDEPLESSVIRRLRARRTILILDNFEQLITGASVVADLAANVESARLLITSQVPLRIGVEQVFSLGPLASEKAAELFIERGRGRAVEFEPTNEERAAINEICARVDCMPLAIELAAGRLGSLGARTLTRHMEHPLAVLTRGNRDLPERQRSLRATIDWTYALLADAPRSLFERLGLCSGPVPLATVEAIADPKQQEMPLDLLETLMECSLVRQHRDARLGIRFFMPQALRDYAQERLATAGLEDSVHRQHAEHVAAVAHAARLWKYGATTEQRTDLLAVSEEIRPAVDWARENDRELHVRLCAALAPYWVYRDIVPEVSEELADALNSGLGSVAERAWISTFLAKCLQLEGNHNGALELADQALENWRMLDDEREYAFGTGDLTWVYRWAPRLDQALALTEEGLEILRRTHDRRLILRALVFLSHVLVDLKHLRRAQFVLEKADQLAGGDPSLELENIHGDCALLSGDYLQAIEYYVKSLAWTNESGESHQVVIDELSLATALARAGRGPAALEVRELARLQQQLTGRFDLEPDRIERLEQALSDTREELGSSAEETAAANAGRVPANRRVARALRLGQQALLAHANQQGGNPL